MKQDKFTGKERVPLEVELPPSTGEATEIIPSGEYLAVTARALSEVIIPGRFLDFTAPGLLASAADKLTGKTVYADHETDIDNWCGIVLTSRYNAESMPPGIDVELKVDAVANPKLARGLTMQPVSPVRALSVGIEVVTEKSHPELDDFEFWRKRGTLINGSVVRSIVTQIRDIYELSFVWSGADPSALVESVRQLSATPEDLDIEKHKEDDVKEILALIKGLQTGDSDASARVASLPPEEKATVLALSVEIDSRKKEIANLTAELNKSIVLAKLWRDEKLSDIQAALTLCGENSDSATMRLARRLAESTDAADYEELAGLAKAMREKAEKAAPLLACKKCGCTELERRSSVAGASSEPDMSHVDINKLRRY